MKSCIDQILALRPADDVPETIQRSIEDMRALRASFLTELEACREKLSKSMLMAPVDEVKALDKRVLELERALPQLDDTAAKVTLFLKERKNEIKGTNLRQERGGLEQKDKELEEWLIPFLQSVAPQVSEKVKAAADLLHQRETYNFRVEQYARENDKDFGYGGQPIRADLPQRLSTSLFETLFARLVIPISSVGPQRRTHIPLVHAGSYWKPAVDEGASPEFMRQVHKDNAERARLLREQEQAKRDAPAEHYFAEHNRSVGRRNRLLDEQDERRRLAAERGSAA